MSNQYILSLVNPDAENGKADGWTSTGSANVSGAGGGGSTFPGPHSGTWYFGSNLAITSTYTLTQDLVINNDSANSDIDTGFACANLSYWQAGYGTGSFLDIGQITLTAMTANKTFIYGANTPSNYTYLTNSWSQRHIGMVLPAGTRWIRVQMQASSPSGLYTEVFFDDISDLYITYGDESASSNVDRLYIEASTDIGKSNANVIQMFAEVILGVVPPRVMVA